MHGSPRTLAVLATLVACTPPPQRKPIEMTAIGTVPPIDRTPKDDGSDAGVMAPNSATPPPKDSAKEGCAGADFDSLDDALKQCGAAMPKLAEIPSGMKDKLEVKLTPSSAQITPGGRVDVTIILRNKSNDSLALWFSGDPTPRFEVEALDTKGKRVDIPPGKQPKWPKGTQPPTREVKAAKITLEKGGTARIKVPWEAVKMKWAPEKAKGWDGRGFPRVPDGPLPNGKYNLRVVVPILNDVDIPKVPIDVGG
jgi:hypothetical protein